MEVDAAVRNEVERRNHLRGPRRVVVLRDDLANPLAQTDTFRTRRARRDDREHRSYDAEAVERFHGALVRCAAVIGAFRARFVGKSSPVHFFWGSFDLAATRFSGRRAPERPGADAVTREAYSHEVISHGFWPGGDWPGAGRVEPHRSSSSILYFASSILARRPFA